MPTTNPASQERLGSSLSTPMTDAACDATAKIWFDDPQLARGIWVGRAMAAKLERDRARLVEALKGMIIFAHAVFNSEGTDFGEGKRFDDAEALLRELGEL